MLHQIFNDFILSAMLLYQWHHRSVTIATAELSNVILNPLAECRPDYVTLTSMLRHICYDDRSVTSFVQKHGRQCMPCSANFSMILETFSNRLTSDFFKNYFFLNSINSSLSPLLGLAIVQYFGVLLKTDIKFGYACIK